MAQTTNDGAGNNGASVTMKGPPNADGMQKGNTMEPVPSGRSDSAPGKMKGPPNANGAPGAQGAGDAK